MCVSGWLHPSPAKRLQSRHVSGAAVFNISYNHWLDRAGQRAGSVVISALSTVRTSFPFTVTPVSERTLPTFLLMA